MSNKKQSLSYHSHFYEKRGLRTFVRRPLTLNSLFLCARRIVVCRTSLHNTVDGPLSLLVDIVAVRRSLVCLHPAVIAEAVALLKTVMVAVNPSPLDLAGLAAVPITEIIAAAANMLNAFFILLFLLLYIPGVHAPFRLKPSLF